MTHRERFTAVVTRGKSDRAVYDLCGTGQTTVDSRAIAEKMAEILKIDGYNPGGYNIDVRILDALDIDTRAVGGRPVPETKRQRTENGIMYDSWGIGYKQVADHGESVSYPLEGLAIDEIMDYEFPDPAKNNPGIYSEWASQAEFLHWSTDFAVVAVSPFFGVFELGCFLFGFEDFLYRLAAEPELVHCFFRKVLEYQKKNIDLYFDAVGRHIDCVTLTDDMGTQAGPFISSKMFDEMVKPYFKEMVCYLRKYTDAFVELHSCGSVYSLIQGFIDCGVDILNPIQPNAHMMECERLKNDFGSKICFWGGIDTQRLLPNGTADDVKTEVKKMLAAMEGCGYVLSPAHTIQHDVPAENVAAIYMGAREYYSCTGQYGCKPCNA